MLSKVKYPVIAQPKIDGVRGLNIESQLFGRSLKRFANINVNARFDSPIYSWMDSELYAGNDIFADDLCRRTTSVMTTIQGSSDVSRVVFDLCFPEWRDKKYIYRLEQMEKFIKEHAPMFVNCTEWRLIDNEDDLLAYDIENLDRGAEGTIARDPQGYYKYGRSTVNEGLLLRIKQYTDEEGIIRHLYEAETNLNEAQTNELGLTYRTSHKANKVGNGRIASMDIELISTGEIVRASAGKLTHAESEYYFKNQCEFLGKIAKIKHFAKGAKDTTRHCTFQGLRDPVDMS
ncbi:hypothetical protein [Vibrio phage vB_VibM_83AMN]|nr:hypothetical protein [Vibrio phage vB_VibM_83AMN]